METIDDICRRIARSNPQSLTACNFYLQAVFGEIYGTRDIQMVGGDANTIVHRLGTAPFNSLGHDDKAASIHATAGEIVVGGLAQDQASGHVFIVQSTGLSKAGLPTPWSSHGHSVLSRGGAPNIFNGSANPKIPTPQTSVDVVFSRSDEKNVIYAWLPDPRKSH